MCVINKDGVTIYNDDYKNVLGRCKDNSVDLIITDPPYKTTKRGGTGNSGGMCKKKEFSNGNGGFRYNDVKISDFVPELYRILKEDSHCYIMTNHVNLYEKYDIEHKYYVRSLLRAEEMSDKLKEKVKEVADASYTENKAKECFNNSLLNSELTIKLPGSELICTLGVQNAYSFIYDSVNAIDKLDAKYNQATILTSAISTIFVPNPDDNGETYLEIDDTEDKIKFVYSLDAKDISILSTKIGEITEGMQFTFGLMDINCQNMKCKNHVNSIEVELDTILFHKYQQAMNITID